MALLGTQIWITLIMVSIIQKLGPHFSLARWLLCSNGLYRYLYPTDEELKTLAGIPKDKNKNKKFTKTIENGTNKFHVPRNLDIQLESSKITNLDVIHVKFYTEYQWLIDFSFYACIVYIMSEIYYWLMAPIGEVNLSMLWCLLVIGFSFKLLLTLTAQYFKGDETVGERSTVIVSAFAYLLVSMMVLIVDENMLEIGLEKAYSSFNSSAAIFLEAQGLDYKGAASKLIIKFVLALWAGLVGCLFSFPGFRMAKMHWDSLRYCQDNKLLRLLLNISYASPFLLVILWIKPISRDYLTDRIFSGMSEPLLSKEAFESFRLIAVIVAVLLRFSLLPIYFQSYLNMAYDRLEQQKKEAGRITNKELQKKIAAVFYYLCVVALQNIAPLIICLYFTFMFKSLGGYSWHGLFWKSPDSDECPLTPPSTINTINDEFNEFNQEESLPPPPEELFMALDSLKKIFTPEVFRGLFGFATWWTSFSWFAASSLGLVYQSYFYNS